MKLSALKKFGLIDENDSRYRVSDLGMRVLLSSKESDTLTALREAALTPDIFREIHTSHGDASSNVLVSYLVLNKGFSEDGARAFDKAYRDTVKVARLDSETYIPSGTTAEPEDIPPVQPQVAGTQQHSSRHQQHSAIPSTPTRGVQRTFTTGNEAMDAEIKITSHSGEITGDDIAFVKDYLDFLERSWSRRKPPAATKPPSSEDSRPIPAAPLGVSVPVMLTKQMESDLRAAGFSQAEINKMTPQQAHENLKAAAQN